MKIKNKFLILLLIFIILISFNLVSFADSISGITSKAAILVEKSTGRIIYEKNSTEKMYPASTTKIMTAILVIENSNKDDIVTVSESALDNIPTGYVVAPLYVGEEISVHDLLCALMISSCNDAAYVLAEYIGGSIDGFSTMMNVKAEELGCKNTHFVNPNGIHNESHYSTAYDMYLIAKYAMENEEFRQYVTMTSYTLPATNKHDAEDRVLKTTNNLIDPNSSLYYKYVVGIKTGHTEQAGNCLVSEADRDGLNFISVTLNGDRFTDTTKLFNYAFDNYTLTKVKEKGSIIDTIEIENATKDTKSLNVLIDDSITIMNNKSLDTNAIIPEISYNDNLEAPILAGQVIGKIKYSVDDIDYEASLIAENDVEKQTYWNILIIAGLILLTIGIVMLKISNKGKKSNKRKR